MANPQNGVRLPRPLRLWPGVVLAVALVFVRFVLPRLDPNLSLYAVLGGIAGAALIFVWWAFFSRAPMLERWGALALVILGLAGTARILHESVASAGMGFLFYFYAIPSVSLALVAWAAASRDLPENRRRATMVATILLTCGAWALVRTGGITGSSDSDFAWRWSATPEERLLALADDAPTAASTAPAAAGLDTGAGWPGFRGARRDGVVLGVRIATDWDARPPEELWRRPIGPGWSSFAVRGDLLYTQEQRGDEETVAAYRISTGEPVWRHADAARFWESNGGAGPRGTPTLRGDRVYAFGATGILNALDADDGTELWSRNVAVDAEARVPGWGFASSPVIFGDLVIVAAAGRLASYDADTGEPRWLGPAVGGGYSSPHLMTIDGIPQLVMLSGAGATSFAPADGTVLWQNAFRGDPIVQPAVLGDDELLISTADAGGGIGVRRLALARRDEDWSIEERWTTRGLKPYFNDYVVHDGHAFGFDGSIMACIDLADGARAWKGGRYGNGQLVLLADQDLLLVLSEDGDLVLVAASPDEHRELARFAALDGKTWNHPALVGDILLVRNGEEMAAFRLRLAD